MQTRAQSHITAIVATHEAAIADHRQAIALMHRELNSLIPVNARLPTSVLAEIFFIYAADYMRRFANSYGWIAGVSHVCHHWRITSLSSPRLWSYVSLNYPKMATKCITRAQNAPLSVRIPSRCLYSGAEEMYAIKEVLSQIHRVVDIVIHPDGPSTWPPLQMTLGLSAPLLTTIVCVAHGYGGVLLRLLLQLNLPKLSYLRIKASDNREWLSLPYPPSLKTLRVNITRSQPDRTQVPLGKLDHLETLKIADETWNFGPGLHALEAQPEFPCLKLLRLTSPYPQKMIDYLELLKFPISTRIRLDNPYGCIELVDVGRILESFGILRSVSVTIFRDDGWCTISGWTERLSLGQVRNEDTIPLITLNCHVPMDVDAIGSWPCPAALAEVLRSVQTLEIVQIATGRHPCKIVEIFLMIARNAIELGIHGPTEVTQHSLSFAPFSLRYLSIGPATVGSVLPIPVHIVAPAFWLYLRLRVKHGKALERLEVPSATVDADTLASLRVLVREVVEVAVL